MTRTQQAHGNELIERRLDALLSPVDAARAKASLRAADVIVDVGFALAAAISSSAAFAVRHLRAAFVSSPSH
jgi:hypothetical protein